MCDGNMFAHPIFNNDPINFHKLLDKYVEVTTSNGKVFKGFVYTIDPVSENIILSIPSNEGFETVLIVNYVMESLKITENPEGFAPPLRRNDSIEELIESDMLERKNQLLNWFSKNLLPVKEVDNVIEVHQGALKIFPPYRRQDCFSENSIILGRIQHLLQNMPIK